MSNSIHENNETSGFYSGQAGIEETLLALESVEKLPDRETYRTAVRDYQNYLVPFLVSEDAAERIFKLHGLYGLESVAIFLSEAVYSAFHEDYLKKHGHLDLIEKERSALVVKSLTGKELFEIVPKGSKDSFFIISSDTGELLFNFNLVEVFIDCFYENPVDIDSETSSDNPELPAADDDIPEGSDPLTTVKKSARRDVETGRKIRGLFEHREWIVLISQPTKNKLLKGEVSRSDFDLDRHGDRRIFIFFSAEALDNYKNATGQSQINLYNIKVDSRRIFGGDLSKYDSLIVNSNSPDASRISRQHFKKLNELYAASELEEKLLYLDPSKKGAQPYRGDYYLFVRRFQSYILPLDMRLPISSDSLPVYLIEDDSGNVFFPVFTAQDQFASFRFHHLEQSDAADVNFIEPHFIDGETLFEILDSLKTPRIIFNHNGSINPLVFQADFILKVYCA